MVKLPSLSNTEQDIQNMCHKEEAEGRIKTDQADRQSLRDTLDVCIDPLEYASQPDGALMNIVTGQSAHPDVNADNAINLGHRAMENFRGGRPDSFYCLLGKLVVTMDVKKNHVLVGKERVYDQELIYAHVIGLLASAREINFNYVLAFELAAYPPSMFNADGKMNVATCKSTLKHKLQVTIYLNVIAQSHTMIHDVSALLCVITWPGKLRVYVDAFKAFVHEALRREMPPSCLTGTSPTAPIPSRGRRDQDQVASSHTRYAGSSEASRPHQHQQQDPSECHAYRGILDPGYFTEATQMHTLTVAGIRDVPVEITGGLRIDRHDLRSTHEEADILIAQQAISLSLLDKSVRVVCDDTYIF